MPAPPSNATPVSADAPRTSAASPNRRPFDLAAALILFLTAAYLAWSSGSFTADLTHHPDEPAHFITGLMVYDYLASAPGRNPLNFARQYYAQYPKVALGHWPPGFYVAEAAAFAVLGPGKTAALVLVELCAAVVALLLYRRCRYDAGPAAALVMALVFLALPLTQAQATAVLAETFLCLLALPAAFAFADFLTDGKTRHLVAFAAWSSLALLTKGNALALGLLPGLAVLLPGRWDLLRSRRLWLTGVAVVLVSGPYYVLTYRVRSQSFHGEWSPAYIAGSFAFYGRYLLDSLGPGVALLCGLGVLEALRPAAAATPAVLLRKTCLAWALSVVIFQAVFPVGRDGRFLFLALPALCLLAARGLCLVLGGAVPALALPRPVVAALVGGLLLGTLPGRLPRQIRGYGDVAEAIPTGEGPSVALVSSSTFGEGAFVVERRLRDPERMNYTLRASKELGESTWIGREYRGRFTSPEELRKYLEASPIRYLVLDEFGSRLQPEEPHQELLRQAVRGAPELFVLRRVLPMRRGDETVADGVYLYENTAAARRPPESAAGLRGKFRGP